MKKTLLTCILFFNLAYVSAQTSLPTLSDLKIPVSDTIELENIVKYRQEFNNENLMINRVYAAPDTSDLATQIPLPTMSDLKLPILDTIELKNIVSHHRKFDNYDYVNDMVVIGSVYIYPDTSNTKIVKEVKEKEYILYFKQKDEFYAFNPDTCIVQYLFHKINNNAILMKEEGTLFNIFVKNSIGDFPHLTYLVRLFNTDTYYLSMFYTSFRDQIRFMCIFYSHPSLEKILEYHFGSTKNYIETYRKREEIRASKRYH
ncbi:MAG: hypothetical protein E6767_05145 [Dysgonomonas sp.]|nr:hypothetical protein [Dysgonomonas sp.]